jgi:simple sugar transport system permease protein
LFAKAILKAGSFPPAVVTAGILVACAVGGAAWAYLSAWLFVKRGVEVVISTILLNFVALQLLGWAISGPLKEAKGQLPMTDLLPDNLMLHRFDRQTDLHVGIFVAIAMAGVVWFFLYQMKAGFRLRVVGDNPRVARANRISAGRMQVVAMLVSGALCGLAGGVEYTGTAGQLSASFSQQWGFLGIPVALLGGLHPLSVVLSAGYFGALFAGSENLARFTPAGTTLIYVIQAAAVLGFVAVRAVMQRKPLVTEAA